MVWLTSSQPKGIKALHQISNLHRARPTLPNDSKALFILYKCKFSVFHKVFCSTFSMARVELKSLCTNIVRSNLSTAAPFIIIKFTILVITVLQERKRDSRMLYLHSVQPNQIPDRSAALRLVSLDVLVLCTAQRKLPLIRYHISNNSTTS